MSKEKRLKKKKLKQQDQPSQTNELAVYQSDLEKSAASYQEVVARIKFTMPKTVENLEDYKKATDCLAFIGMRTKAIDALYKYHYAPVQAKAKQMKADYAKFMNPLTELEVMVKERMKAWMLAEQKKKDEEQKRLEERALKNNKTDAMVKVPVVNNIAHQEGDYGSSTARKVLKWRVIDEDKIPRKYLVIDSVAVNQAVRAGKQISGIEVYDDITIAKGRL